MLNLRKVPPMVAALALAALALAAPAFAAVETFKIDTTHSTVSFKVRHLVARSGGVFKKFGGTIDLDRAAPTASKVDFKVDVTSVDTGNESRDKHLNSPDFFDTAKFPEMTFKSTKIVDKGASSFEVTGDLTLRGVTKPVTLTVSNGGFVKGRKGADVTGFEVSGKINRNDFGVSYDQAGVVVGQDVEITITIEAATVPPAPPATAGTASPAGTTSAPAPAAKK